MTLLSLFWPKEMREAVKRLRAEGNLNEEAVKFVNGKIITRFFVFLATSLAFFLWAGEKGQYLSLILILTTPFLISYDIKTMYTKFMAPYLLGHRVNGCVNKVVVDLWQQQWISIDYAGSAITVLLGEKPRLEPSEIPSVSQSFQFYWSEQLSNAMPVNTRLMKYYSLSNQHIQE